jgi:hypothetical protein
MNPQIKTILLTVLTLSCLAIAMVELSGVSSTALFNKYGIGNGGHSAQHEAEKNEEEVVKHAFHFKNTGNAPLLIIKALASCGCTVPSVPKAPIAPGGEGDIMVEFDSNNRKGHNHKNVLVFSNATLERMPIAFDADVQ